MDTTPAPNESQGAAAGRYHVLETLREPYLIRARDCSLYTIPALVPPLGFNATSKLYQPFQSIGARGVNNLAAKLLLTLFPPNSPFFRLLVSSFVEDELAQSDPQIKADIEQALGKIEKAVQEEVMGSDDRNVVAEVLKHLVVAGNALLYIAKDGARLFPMERYVVKRDGTGKVLEVVTKEMVAPTELAPEVQAQINKGTAGAGLQSAEKNVAVYTHVCLDNGMYKAYQEINGIRIAGSDGSWPEDRSPYIALRMIRIDGEDWGRSYIEEYLGDLKSLESLSQSIVEASAAMARLLIFVKPGSTTRLKTIQNAPNGAVREGNAEDVTVLQMQKYPDLKVTQETASAIEARLAFAFLLNTAIQRNGERVTAEEIRFMSQELDTSLGGVYGVLSKELQLPYLNRRMALMEQARRLPRLPKDKVKISIVTGVEALGRGEDRNKLVAFVGTVAQLGGPQVVGQYIDMSNLLERLATADGIDPEGLVKKPEQIAAEQQQAQQDAMQQQIGPKIVDHAGGTISNVAKAAVLAAAKQLAQPNQGQVIPNGQG
jgi:hypothetical protein